MKFLWYFGRCPFEIVRWVCGTSGDVKTLCLSVGRWVCVLQVMSARFREVSVSGSVVLRSVSARCREVSVAGLVVLRAVSARCREVSVGQCQNVVGKCRLGGGGRVKGMISSYS